MAAIGKLVVTLTTKTAKFQKGLKRASAGIAKMASQMGASIKRAGKWGAALAAATAAGLAYFTKQSFSAIDATAKMSKQLGVTIDGLRGMQRAAELTGASEEQLHKGLGFLNKALGEAKTGIGEGRQALEQLGLSADDLTAIPLEEAVGRIADNMGGLSTQADRAYVASKLFGRGGLALLNMLDQGSAGMRDMADGAKVLQGSLTAFDAAKVEAANDSIRDLRSTWSALFDRIAVATAPTVQRVADNLSKVMIWLRGQTGSIVPAIIGWFEAAGASAVKFVETVWKWVRQIPGFIRYATLEAYRIFRTGIIKIESVWATFRAVFSTGWEGIGTLIGSMWDNVRISFWRSMSWIGDKIVGIAEWLSDRLPGKQEWIKNLIDGYRQGLGQVDQIASNIADSSAERWSKFWAGQEDSRRGLTADLAALENELSALEKVLAGTGADILAGRDAGGGWGDAIKRAIEGIRNVKLPNITDALEKGGQVAGGAIADAVRSVVTPGAIERGTVEAYSRDVRSAYADLTDNSDKTLAQMKRQNQLQERGVGFLQEIADGAAVMEIP